MMAELTIGYVSGIIAAAVFLVQLFVPTSITLILVGVIGEKHTAVTWSVVSRLLHGSYWPVLLGGDTAASTGASHRVRMIAWLQPISLFLIAITAIVTPLGLYDKIAPDDDPVSVAFQYAPDTSPFGRSTLARSEHKSLRTCGDLSFNCPSAPPETEWENIEDLTEAFQIWQSSVDLFTSGNTEPTVSSVFDVEWRSYFVSTNVSDLRQGKTPFAKGFHRQLAMLALHEKVEAVEGLVVDSNNAGIGFRNHTVPLDVGLGYQWTEDILFVEPVTHCVNTNLTIEYKLKGGSFGLSSSKDHVLVDNGGFVNLDHTEPEAISGNPQDDPKLSARAYSVAWHYNMLMMQYFNVTTNGSDGSVPFSYMDSQLGKKFKIGDEDGDVLEVVPNSIQTSRLQGHFIHLPDDYYFNSTMRNLSSFVPEAQTGPNPLNLTSDRFSDLADICETFGRNSSANETAVGVNCGWVFGAHTRLDGGSPMMPDANSLWSMPLYSCATAPKATIKRVTFSVNQSLALEDLKIDRIEDKFYSSQSDMPLWGVENLANRTAPRVRPLWGIVSPQVGEREDISTIQREYLWIPGYPSFQPGTLSGGAAGEANMPGNTIFVESATNIYGINSISTSETIGYTGLFDPALYAKWKDLSNNATGIALMLNLVYTDMVANAVVGTRSWLSDSQPADANRNRASTNVTVLKWSRKIRYHLPYIIPAAICLLLIALITGILIILLLFRRTGPGKMKIYLAQTSAGRILGTFLYPGASDPLAPTKVWIQQVGTKSVNLMGGKMPVPQTYGSGGGPLYTNIPASQELLDMRLKNPSN